jgi:hypothetical protein
MCDVASVYNKCIQGSFDRVVKRLPLAEVEPGESAASFSKSPNSKDPASKVLISCDTKYCSPINTQYHNARMSVQTPNGTISAENADNFEDIEKQFAVKGEPCKSAIPKT